MFKLQLNNNMFSGGYYYYFDDTTTNSWTIRNYLNHLFVENYVRLS